MIARVRGVTAASTRASSMLSVSGLMSTNTGTPPRSNRVRSRDEGEGRHHDLVAGADVEEERRHLECRGAGMGEEHRAGADPFPEPGLAAFGVGAVAGKLPARDRVADVIELHAGKRRTVEGDGHAGAPPRTQQLIPTRGLADSLGLPKSSRVRIDGGEGEIRHATGAYTSRGL